MLRPTDRSTAGARPDCARHWRPHRRRQVPRRVRGAAQVCDQGGAGQPGPDRALHRRWVGLLPRCWCLLLMRGSSCCLDGHVGSASPPLRRCPTITTAEIHNIVGAGKSDGAMDASNLLKVLWPTRAQPGPSRTRTVAAFAGATCQQPAAAGSVCTRALTPHAPRTIPPPPTLPAAAHACARRAALHRRHHA